MKVVIDKFKAKKTIPFLKEIRFHPDLNFGEMVFLAEIHSLTSGGKSVMFSSRKLAEIFNVSHQTILNWVRKLQKLDLLEIDCDFQIPHNKISIKSKIK